MPSSAAFVDAALKLGEQELEALERDDFDGATAFAERRDWLLTQAWEARTEADKDAYRARLEKMRDMQQRLLDVATQKQATSRGALQRSRKEGKRLAGYQQAMSQAATLIGNFQKR